MEFKTENVWVRVSVTHTKSPLDGVSYINAEVYEPGQDQFDHDRTLLKGTCPVGATVLTNPDDSEHLKALKNAVSLYQRKLNGELNCTAVDIRGNTLNVGDTVGYSANGKMYVGKITKIDDPYSFDGSPRLTIASNDLLGKGNTVFIDAMRVVLAG